MSQSGSDNASSSADRPDEAILTFVRQAGLCRQGETFTSKRLTGGVASDIWLVRSGAWAFCVKRALPKLKVAVDWRAPVERNANEANWLRTIAAFMPEAAPAILAEDSAVGVFAMSYLPEADYPIWKTQLRQGRVDLAAAAEVGSRLARIHSVTARNAELAARFASDDIFHAIRLAPYLLATAEKHPDLAARLQQLVTITAETKLALVHGDVSPKNILIGPNGPVFLDAECAWWGDPAFDLAFCLNHLLLKCLWVPLAAPQFLRAFDRLVEANRPAVDWEPFASLERRTSHLLPGLFLARVDGKSPVEYVTAEPDRARVRKIARAHLMRPVARLSEIADAWADELALGASRGQNGN